MRPEAERPTVLLLHASGNQFTIRPDEWGGWRSASLVDRNDSKEAREAFEAGPRSLRRPCPVSERVDTDTIHRYIPRSSRNFATAASAAASSVTSDPAMGAGSCRSSEACSLKTLIPLVSTPSAHGPL